MCKQINSAQLYLLVKNCFGWNFPVESKKWDGNKKWDGKH